MQGLSLPSLQVSLWLIVVAQKKTNVCAVLIVCVSPQWSLVVASITEIPPLLCLPNFLVQRRVLRPLRTQTGGTIMVGIYSPAIHPHVLEITIGGVVAAPAEDNFLLQGYMWWNHIQSNLIHVSNTDSQSPSIWPCGEIHHWGSENTDTSLTTEHVQRPSYWSLLRGTKTLSYSSVHIIVWFQGSATGACRMNETPHCIMVSYSCSPLQSQTRLTESGS